MDPNKIILLVVLSVIVCSLIAFAVTHVRASKASKRVVDQLLRQDWYGVVIGSSQEHVALNIPTGAGTPGGKCLLLVVNYQLDDGTTGSLSAYEDDALKSLYLGDLAFARDAPGFSELSSWRPGDRLHKPAGEHWPRLIA